MRGKLAADSEVAGGAHQPRAEDLLPEAVDHHAGRQRMLGPDQPLRQAKPVLGQVGRHRRQCVGRVRLDRVAALVVLAAVEHDTPSPARRARASRVRTVPRFLMAASSASRAASLLLAASGKPGRSRRATRRRRRRARRAAACRPAFARVRPLGQPRRACPTSRRRQGAVVDPQRVDRPTGRFATPCAAGRP